MLFTFPSRYWYTIGLTRVFSLAGWSRRIRAEFLVLRVTQDTAMPLIFSCKGLSPAMARLSSRFHSKLKCNDAVLLPRPSLRPGRFGLFPGRSPLLGESLIYFLFLEVLRCFSSLRWPPQLMWMNVVKTYGLSHSETRGSMVICTYPQIIAAYRVLHRLSEPRHPPCALSYFLIDWPS